MNEMIEAPLAAEPPRQVMQVANPTPEFLLQTAIERGASIDQLEKLLAMKERFDAARAKQAYDESFAAFKAEAVKIIKNRAVTAGPLNGKKYAELFAVVNAVTPALSKHGLSSSWVNTKDEKEWIEVTCILRHSAGHTERVSMGGPPDVGGAKNGIQARASTVTYLQRYTLKAILGLSEQDDDDDGRGGRERKDRTEDKEVPVDILNQGRDKAMQGMRVLTAWFNGLTPEQRRSVQAAMPGWRDAAVKADGRS